MAPNGSSVFSAKSIGTISPVSSMVVGFHSMSRHSAESIT
jgi:hypothetical protein